MFSAANKLAILALGTAVAVATACTSESERRAAAAEQLRTQAESLAASGNYEQAIALLDSIDQTYREQTDIRRKAMATRATTIESRALQQIGPAEIRMAQAQLRTDSLQKLFVHIDGPRGLEGYSVAKELAKQDVTDATGIQPRLDHEGYLCIAAVVKKRNIGLNSLSITTQDGTQQVEPISGERCINSDGTELAVFRQEEVAHVLETLEKAEGKPVKIHLNGTRGSVEVKLTPALRTALVRSWQYAMALQELRSAHIERERLERTLQTARDHRANAPVPSPADTD